MLTSNTQQTPYGIYQLGYGGYERSRDTNLVTWRIDRWVGVNEKSLQRTMVTGADDNSPVNTVYNHGCDKCYLSIAHSTDAHSKDMGL